MTVRKKTLLIFGITLVGLLSLIAISSRIIQLRSFRILENKQACSNIDRVLDALTNEQEWLDSKVNDWAQWDDMYAFIQHNNPAFIRSNLVDATFSGLRLNVIMLINNRGQLVYGKAYNLVQNRPFAVPHGLQRRLTLNDPLLHGALTGGRTTGVLLLPEGPLLVAVQPILTSTGKGPIRGAVLIGRFLDADRQQHLSIVTHLGLSLQPLSECNFPPAFTKTLLRMAANNSFEIQVENEGVISAYAVIKDISHKPALLLHVQTPRTIYHQGETSIRYFLLCIVGAGIVFGIVTLLLLERMVLARLSYLNERVTEIGETRNLSARISLSGQDELATLACTVNEMLTSLENSQQAIRLSEERYRTLVEFSPDALYIVSRGKCVFTNAAGIALFGATGYEEVIGKSLIDFVHPNSHELAKTRKTQFEMHEEIPYTEITIQRLDHIVIEVEVCATPFPYQGAPGMLLLIHDITKRKQDEERLNNLAYYDSLTGLPNRLLFSDRLTQALTRAHRYQEQIAVLLLDLDHFKDVNDSLGHDTGDRLLHEVAARLTMAVRECDTVARLSGDEFCLILPRLTDAGAADMAARRILELFFQPFVIGEHQFYITPSMGISMYPADGNTIETLVKNADLAMYRTKAMGRNNYKFFSRDMGEAIAKRRTLESHLRTALEREEFIVHYQPQVSLHTEQIVGVEALVRWQHPEWGLVSPGQFIPLAEEIGLIEELDAWVLRTACRQNYAWQMAGLPPVRVAVNLSAHHFQRQDLCELLNNALTDSGLAPEYLEVEVTESTAMLNLEHTLTVLREVHNLGVRVTIDDFGTGYSSLSYLKKLPVQTLKIDRSFIQDMLHDPDDATIVATIIAMAHTLRRAVIAEGVELNEQLDFLRTHHCDEIQGFLFGKPAPAEEIAAMLRNPFHLTDRREDREKMLVQAGRG